MPHGSDVNGTISLAEALAVIARNFHAATRIETVTIAAAQGRIVASDIVAPIAVPPADNSAVDGYAFRHGDLTRGGALLRIIGRSAAGHPFAGQVGPGEAVRIFTGAVMPGGADTVAMQENVSATPDSVAISVDMRPGDNRRFAGEDIAAGARVLSAGQSLGAAEIGILASLGMTRIAVRTSLRAAVFSVGDELIDGGKAPAAGQIHDSNRPMLLALLKSMGVGTTDLGILPDRQDVIGTELAKAEANHDAIVCSAGMSVGDEDHVKAAVAALGGLDFWSVAIKPGRPIAIGRIGAVPFFGLPGNPVAMIVNFLMIVRPALLRLSGATIRELRRFPVEADFSAKRKTGRREFIRCTLHETDDNRLLARRFQRDGSGVLSAVAASDGLLEIAEHIDEIAPGMRLPFIPFAGLGL
jgi:molybdopterin molybdotransferase